MTEYEARIRKVIQNVCDEHNIYYRSEEFDIEDSGKYSHETPKFRSGKKSVFLFIEYGTPDRTLGVYYCGANSQSRFCYDHYKPHTSTPSTLAKTLYDSYDSGHYKDENIGEWLKRYTRRINIFFSVNYEPDKPAFIDSLKARLQEEFNAQYNLTCE